MTEKLSGAAILELVKNNATISLEYGAPLVDKSYALATETRLIAPEQKLLTLLFYFEMLPEYVAATTLVEEHVKGQGPQTAFILVNGNPDQPFSVETSIQVWTSS